MNLHPFDQAMVLQTQPDGSTTGTTSPDYWNMIGPFGGITAAAALNAVLQHPQCLGEPIALTVNFAGAMLAGGYVARARPARTNRSTQHWIVELLQADDSGALQVTTTATAVTALRRSTFGGGDQPLPTVPPPAEVPRVHPPAGVEWLARYEMRPVHGAVPLAWDGQEGTDTTTRLWMRDDIPRALDFCSLAALADVFFPRIWLRRAQRVPVGTVSMTVYFHAGAAQLADNGPAHLLAQATGQEFRHGFFDHSGQLWRADGLLLATTHQIVYFKG
ncbi:MAG: acyl-CoA thioesterase [Burkholderiales bacterium PBB5]|nr:MAG: acyl-CoA thioesterase [Burkholderiales bacterium PBB5]